MNILEIIYIIFTMDWKTTTALMVSTLVVLIYMYLTCNHNYWSNLGIPGPTPIPIFGTYLQQFTTPFQVSEEARYKKYGKIYGIYDGTTPGLIIGEPRLIKQIMNGSTSLETFLNRRPVKTTHPIMSKFLSSLEDTEWKRVRSITTPRFSSGKLKSNILPIMMDCAGPMLATLNMAASNGSDLDLKQLFGSYTMDIIARSAFATAPTPIFVSEASQLFTFPFWRKFLDYVAPMWALESLGFTVLPKYPMEFFGRITEKLIAERQASGLQIHDFLQLLLNAHDDTATKLGTSKYLTKDEILSQSVLFFSVGYETSSQLLTYVAYCLALNPAIQDKAANHVKLALEECNGVIGHELLGCAELNYINALIDETLRLYNPVLRMERHASEDFTLDGARLVIPKGMIVGIPVWALHHCDEYWPSPYEFQPERFLPENKHKIIPGTYLPFGDGPRNCIGSRFALLECKLALVEILKYYKFVPCTNTKIPIEFVPTGRPLLGPKAVIVKVEKL